MTTKPGIVPAKDMPPGPRGLGGYCWLQDPKTGFHCCQPVGHEGQGVEHLHPYTTPVIRWR